MENQILEPRFKTFLALLNQHQVEYLVIGGYAVSVHGYVRATGDIDIWLNATVENADKMLTVMLAFGFDVYDFRLEDFLPEQGGFVSIGDAPFKIELLTNAAGVTFSEAYPNRKTIEIDGVPIHFIGLQELIQNKKAVGRPKDLEDIANLQL
jgi:predicted nucleotidyltransferase